MWFHAKITRRSSKKDTMLSPHVARGPVLMFDHNRAMENAAATMLFQIITPSETRMKDTAPSPQFPPRGARSDPTSASRGSDGSRALAASLMPPMLLLESCPPPGLISPNPLCTAACVGRRHAPRVLLEPLPATTLLPPSAASLRATGGAALCNCGCPSALWAAAEEEGREACSRQRPGDGSRLSEHDRPCAGEGAPPDGPTHFAPSGAIIEKTPAPCEFAAGAPGARPAAPAA